MKEERIGIIIQARTGSTRLPKKVLLDFYNGEGILELICKKLKKELNIPIVLATSDLADDSEIEELANSLGIPCFRGSEHNVLKRFIDAAEKYNFQKIIRICADNPFLDISAIKDLINTVKTQEANYYGFKTSNNTPTIKTHFGLWAEGVNLKALKRCQSMTTETIYTEHVTNYIYENDHVFNCNFSYIPKKINDLNLRLTIDTKEDFQVGKEIYRSMIKQKKTSIFEFLPIIERNNQWKNSMQNQIHANSK